MMDVTTDIDIDFADRNAALDGLRHVAAVDAQRHRHICAVYFHDIPTDPLDGMAAWDSDTAQDHGFFKVDFLNNSIYNGVRDEAHLIDLLVREPPWDLFDDEDVVSQLAQIKNHYPIVHSIRPRSIEDLAVCLALIRPGKRKLVGQPREVIDREIWQGTGDDDDYSFKKSHSIAFAASIVVQLNLMIEAAWT